ncbi:MAG: hypothetical protein QG618_575 [Thermodesulfobacteriota bacterium]|nr:hypothetical protein [Thermodesulfobacteriota bacterium]
MTCHAAPRPVAMQVTVERHRIRKRLPPSSCHRLSKKYQEIPKETATLRHKAVIPAENPINPDSSRVMSPKVLKPVPRTLSRLIWFRFLKAWCREIENMDQSPAAMASQAMNFTDRERRSVTPRMVWAVWVTSMTEILENRSTILFFSSWRRDWARLEMLAT